MANEMSGMAKLIADQAKRIAELEAQGPKRPPRKHVAGSAGGKSVKVPAGSLAIILPIADAGQKTGKEGSGKNWKVAGTGGNAILDGVDGSNGTGLIVANVNVWQETS